MEQAFRQAQVLRFAVYIWAALAALLVLGLFWMTMAPRPVESGAQAPRQVEQPHILQASAPTEGLPTVEEALLAEVLLEIALENDVPVEAIVGYYDTILDGVVESRMERLQPIVDYWEGRQTAAVTGGE
mgnify:CR=1 FL=1